MPKNSLSRTALGRYHDHDDRHAILQEVGRYASPQAPCVSSANGDAVITNTRFNTYEGPLNREPYVRLGLCRLRPCKLSINTEHYSFAGTWNPGALMLTLPDVAGEMRSTSVEMIGMAFVWRHGDEAPSNLPVEELVPLASATFNDNLLSAMLQTLWYEAELHGATTAFFDHCLSAVQQRLCELRHQPIARPDHRRRKMRAFSSVQFHRVQDLIESNLGSNIGVGELANELAWERTRFTKAFIQHAGCTPYEFLTLRRMERAKLHLREGLSVTETAMRVGYANPSKFAAAFRRFNGASPREWQQGQQ